MGTTTPNLNLYKPGIGESGWGNLVNTNFDTLDSIIAGLGGGAPGGGGGTLFVAAVNATAAERAIADYVCDGTADEVQINAALSALGDDGKVMLSEGQFTIVAPITIRNQGVCLEGMQMGSKTTAAYPAAGTRILADSSFSGSYMLEFGPQTSEAHPIGWGSIRNFVLDGANVVNIDGLRISAYISLVENVLVTRTRDGVTCKGATGDVNWNLYNTQLRFVHSMENSRDGFVLGTNATDMHMTNCIAGTNGRDGFHMIGGSGLIATSCHFYDSGRYNGHLEGAGSYSDFTGCRFDNNQQHGLVIDSTNGTIYIVRFVSCWFNRAGLATNNTYDHVYFPGNTNYADGVSFVGCQFFWQGSGNKARWGLNTYSGWTRNCRAIGCYFEPNAFATGPLNDGGTNNFLEHNDSNLRYKLSLPSGTNAGYQIGTTATQKISLWGATPIVQPSNTTDLRVALINTGLIASGGATPLDLNGGTLTAASISATFGSFGSNPASAGSLRIPDQGWIAARNNAGSGDINIIRKNSQDYIEFGATALDLKLRGPYFDVRAYGAVGNGSTDDTTAVQAAIDATQTIGGGRVYFPPGTYIVSQLLLKTRVELVGDGYRSVIKQKASTTGAMIINYDDNVFWSRIHNLLLDGNKTNQTATNAIISLNFTTYVGDKTFRIDNCHIQNAKGDGVYIHNVGACEVSGCYMIDNEGYGVQLNSAPDNLIYNCSIGHSGKAGVYITLSSGNRIVNVNSFWSAYVDGTSPAFLVDQSNGNTFVGCLAEDSQGTGDGYKITGYCSGTIFRACHSASVHGAILKAANMTKCAIDITAGAPDRATSTYAIDFSGGGNSGNSIRFGGYTTAYTTFNNGSLAGNDIELNGVAQTDKTFGNVTLTTLTATTVNTGTLSTTGNANLKGPVPWIDVTSYGADPTGVSNSDTAIQAAIDALPAVGGVIFFPPGYYLLGAGLSIQRGYIQLVGSGRAGDFDQSPSQKGSTIRWNGSAGGTMLDIQSPGTTTILRGISIESLTFDGAGSAAIGLSLKNLHGGRFQWLEIRSCTTAAITTTSKAVASGEKGVVKCLFDQILIRQDSSGGPTAHGIVLDGADTSGNTWSCTFKNVHINFYNGTAFRLLNCDTNWFIGCVAQRLTSATTGIHLELNGSNTSQGLTARRNVFVGFSQGADAGFGSGGIIARGTGLTYPSMHNSIYGLTTGNNNPLPTIETGATLYYHTDDGYTNGIGVGISPISANFFNTSDGSGLVVRKSDGKRPEIDLVNNATSGQSEINLAGRTVSDVQTRLQIACGPANSGFYTISAHPILFGTSSTERFRIPSGDGIDLNQGSFTNYQIRFKNNTVVSGRNNAGSADISLFKINTSDQFELLPATRISDSVTINGAQTSTAKKLHLVGDIAIEYGTDATFVERTRSGLIIHANDPTTPTAVHPYMHLIVQGKGDNATFIGKSGMYVQARDRTDVTGSNKGVLYAAQFSVVPTVARNNVPFDDVACIVCQHEGSAGAKGTDAIYVGHNTAFTGTNKEWISGMLIAANCDYGYRLSSYAGGGGQFINGIRLDEGTYSGSAIKLGNTQKIASLNAAAGADVNLIWLDNANAVNIADGGENVYMGVNAATGENPELRIYGYRTGVGVKYGTHWVDNQGNYNIQSNTSQVLGLAGLGGLYLNWGSQADVSLFAGSSGSTTNRSLTIAGWDGSAIKTGTLKISTGGIFQMVPPTAGLHIATAVGDKVGFYGTSPIVQPGSAGGLGAITVSNYTGAARSFNRSSYTMDQLADLVCQLYLSIKTMGLVA